MVFIAEPLRSLCSLAYLYTQVGKLRKAELGTAARQ